MQREFKSRRLSSYVSKEFGSNCATVHVQKKKNSCHMSQETDTTLKSLIVYQDRRKLSSPTSHLEDQSKRSSYSDLADEEYNVIQLQDLDCVPRSYSAIV